MITDYSENSSSSLSGDTKTKINFREVFNDEPEIIFHILGATNAMIVVINQEGKIVYFNHACEQTSGWSFDQVKNKYFWEILCLPEEVVPLISFFKKPDDSQFPDIYENHWTTPAGENRLISWFNKVLHNKDGSIKYIISTGIDVTEQKRAESDFKQIFDKAVDGIRLVDTDFNIFQVNDAFVELSGLSKEHVIGKKCYDIFTGPLL